MKHILTLLMIPALFIGVWIGRATSPAIQFGTIEADLAAEQVKSQALRKQYIQQSERLKETTVIDLNLGDTSQWSQAYVDAATEIGVSIPQATTTTAISNLMRNKYKQLSKICNNPNSETQGPIKQQFANPQ